MFVFCIKEKSCAGWKGQTLAKDDVMLRNFTIRKIDRRIFTLAGPAILSMVAHMAFNVVNIFWISILGTEAIAALTAASMVLWSLETVGVAVATGMLALIARRIGEKRLDDAGHIAVRGIALGFYLSIFVALAVYLLRERIFALLGTAARVSEMGETYLVINLAGLFALFMLITADSVFRSHGDTRTVMIVSACTLALNALLDPFLILGLLFFPRLGVAGAGISSVIAMMVASGIFLVILHRRGWIRWQGLGDFFRVEFPLAAKILRIGIPASASMFIFSLVYMTIVRIAAPFGTAPIAALGIGHRIEGFSFMNCVGFSIATSALVGQSLGARKPRLARLFARRSQFYIALIMGFFTLLYFFLAPQIASIFSHDPEIVEIGSWYLRIIAFSQIFMGIEIVCNGAFSGAGYTLIAMLIAIPFTLLRIPLAYLLANPIGFGVPGIWAALTISSILKGSIFYMVFRRGQWLKTKV